jgi:hypothetical protein
MRTTESNVQQMPLNIVDQCAQGKGQSVPCIWRFRSSSAAIRLGPEQREKVIEFMTTGLLAAYRYFRKYEKLRASTHGSESLISARAAPGRNTSVAAAVQLYTRSLLAQAETVTPGVRF